MGEIIGWDNLHGDEEQQEDWLGSGTPLDSIAEGEDAPLLDEETASAVIYETVDEENNTQNIQTCTTIWTGKETGCIELKPHTEKSLEPLLRDTLVSASENAYRTDQICRSIREIKPVRCGAVFDERCDITQASLNNIRALIALGSAYDLDYFRIMQAVQSVVKDQADGARWTAKPDSPNLNELISFLSSCAQANRRRS